MKKDKIIWCLDCNSCKEEVISEIKSICDFTCCHPSWRGKEVDINEYIPYGSPEFCPLKEKV